jgi:hypothetical protein
MPLDLSLHNAIENYNVLQGSTDLISDYFRSYPSLFKVALLVNHVFRAAAMIAFSLMLPFSTLVNIGICFAGSLFYRLTVETNCAYKFALPAFAGSIAFPMGVSAMTGLINGLAFASLSAFGIAFASLLPLSAYIAYIALTVNYDVDHR